MTMVMLGTRLVCNIAVTWKPAWLLGWVGITAGCVHRKTVNSNLDKQASDIDRCALVRECCQKKPSRDGGDDIPVSLSLPENKLTLRRTCIEGSAFEGIVMGTYGCNCA